MAKKHKMKNVERPCADHERCINVVNLIIDGEANEEEEAFFYSHIRECFHCAQFYKLEQSIRKAIRDYLEIKEAPEELIMEVRKMVKESLMK